MRRATTALTLITAAAALLLAGCAGTPTGGGTPTAAGTPGAPTPAGNPGGGSGPVANFLFGAPAQTPAPGLLANPIEEYGCPRVQVRQGAATYQALGRGSEPGVQALRFQASLTDFARECALLGQTLTIKVGVEGRVILGSAGTPGRVDVPVRIALVREGTQPQTLWTKLYRVPVDVPAGSAGNDYVHVEEDLTVEVTNLPDIRRYVIYVGYDAAALAPQPARGRPRS